MYICYIAWEYGSQNVGSQFSPSFYYGGPQLPSITGISVRQSKFFSEQVETNDELMGGGLTRM